MKPKGISTLLIIVVLAAIVIGVFVFYQNPSGIVPQGGKISPSLDTEFQISDYELVTEETTTITLRAFQRFPQGRTIENVTMEIVLPSNLELVSGDLVWHGDIGSSDKPQIQAVVKAVQKGIVEIKGQAISYKAGSVDGDIDFQYVCLKSMPTETCVLPSDLEWPLCPTNGCDSPIVFQSGTQVEVTQID